MKDGEGWMGLRNMLKTRVRNAVVIATALVTASSLAFGISCKKPEPDNQSQAGEVLSSSKVPRLTSKDQLKDGFVLLDIGMNYCPNCRDIDAIVERLAERFETQSLKLFKLNSHDDPELVYEIMGKNWHSYPVVLFFKDGKEVHRLLGGAGYDWMIGDLKRQGMVIAGPDEGKQEMKGSMISNDRESGRGITNIN